MGSGPIGEIPIIITGDYSELATAITEATQAATQGAETIASAFNVPDAGKDLTAAIDGVTNATVSAGEQFSLFGGQVEDISAQMQLFDTGALSAADSMTQIGDGAAVAAPQIQNVGDATEHAGDAAHETGIEWGELGKTLAELTGITVTVEALKELASEAIAAFSTIQNASIALTAMSGSAEKAAEQIEGLEVLANQDALSFPSLLSAGQRMTAFGMSAEQVTQALGLAADAAAATGNSFDQVSNSLTRIVESGTAGARQLVQLGVTQQQLAAVMGVSATEITSAFKAMDPTERLAIISQALQKFSGDAKLMTQTVTGQWNELANASEKTFATIGASTAPAIAGLTAFASYVISGFGEMWKANIGVMQAAWTDFMAVLEFGSIEAANVFIKAQAEAKAGADAIAAAFVEGKSAADQFFTSMAGESAKLTDTQTALANMAVTLQTATGLFEDGKISGDLYQATVAKFGKAFDEASVNGQTFADTLLGVSTAQVKATNLLQESLGTLQQVTPGTADYARAIQNVGAAWDAANPGGVKFADTLMGIGQQTSQQEVTFKSLSATFAQLSAGFAAGAVSADVFLNTAAKLASAAAAVHQPFASVAVDLANITYETQQAATANDAAIGAFDAIYRQYLQGTIGLQGLLKALQDAEAAAKNAGTAFSNAAAEALKLNQNAALQIQAFRDDIAILGQFTSVLQLTDSQSIAAGNAIKNLQTAGSALGITITAVAGAQNAFNLTTTDATPAVQNLVQHLAQLFTQNGLTVTATNNVSKAIQGVQTEATAAGPTITTFGGAAADAAAKVQALGVNSLNAVSGLQQLVNPLVAAQDALNGLTRSANNQVTSAQGVFDAWVSLNSQAQTTVAGQIAVMQAFSQAQAALAKFGIELSTTGATTHSSSTAVQALVKQLNDAIQAMQNTPGPAANAASGIASIGSAAAKSGAQLDGFAASANKAFDAAKNAPTGFGPESGLNGATVTGIAYLQLLKAMGALESTIDQTASAMLGLVKVATDSFVTLDEWNSTFGKLMGVTMDANGNLTSLNTTLTGVNAKFLEWSGNTAAASTATASNTAAVAANTSTVTASTVAYGNLVNGIQSFTTSTQALTDVNNALGTSFADVGNALQAVEQLIGTSSGDVKAALEALASELNSTSKPLQEVAYNSGAATTAIGDLGTAAGTTADALKTAAQSISSVSQQLTLASPAPNGQNVVLGQNGAPTQYWDGTKYVTPNNTSTTTGGGPDFAAIASTFAPVGINSIGRVADPQLAQNLAAILGVYANGGLSASTNTGGLVQGPSQGTNFAALGQLALGDFAHGAANTPSYTTGNPLPVKLVDPQIPNINITVTGAGQTSAQIAQSVQQAIITTLRQAGLKI